MRTLILIVTLLSLATPLGAGPGKIPEKLTYDLTWTGIPVGSASQSRRRAGSSPERTAPAGAPHEEQLAEHLKADVVRFLGSARIELSCVPPGDDDRRPVVSCAQGEGYAGDNQTAAQTGAGIPENGCREREHYWQQRTAVAAPESHEPACRIDWRAGTFPGRAPG